MRTNATLPVKPKKESTQHRHVLEVLAIAFGWRRIVEVGIWKGDTGAYLLSALPGLEWFGIDPFQIPAGSMSEPGYCNYGHVDMNKVCQGTIDRMKMFGERAVVVRASSEEGAKLLGSRHKQFDAVFIDGDHRYEFVQSDIKSWLPLVKSGGFLLGHDYDMPSVKQAVDEEFGQFIKQYPDRVWAFETN